MMASVKKEGMRWIGCCPFYEDTAACLSVNAEEKLFYCFGCGRGGTIGSFMPDPINPEWAIVELVALDREEAP